MKTFIKLLTVCLLFTSCGLSNSEKMIAIKGQISSPSKSNVQKVKSTVPTLADAAKVLVFYGNKYSLTNITNGSFTTQAPEGSASCLVFLDANNRFIGNLFAGGINVLPLVNMGNASSIDLSTLTLDGTRVIPANDPIGSTIQLTSQELDFLNNVGVYYQTLAKNIDMDNDGSPDIINGDQIRVNSVINMRAGTFGTDTKAVQMIPQASFVVNTAIRVAGDINMFDKNFTSTFSGPAGAPYTDIQTSWSTQAQNEFIFMFSRMDQPGGLGQYPSRPFADGVYSFQLNKNQLYTFNFSIINMQNNLMIIKPTIHTDNNSYITKISYEFVFPDGTIANPHNLIQGYIRTQIGNQTGTQFYEGHHLYGTFSAGENYDYYNETIGTKIRLSDVSQCNFAFIDILGNEYEYSWVDDLTKYRSPIVVQE